ncbi:MAG: alpha/beta fold hydrolase [Bacteroidota bacterium]
MLYPFAFLTARPAVGKKNIAENGEREIAYYTSGEGPRVVLAASLGREASDFNELVNDLNQAGFRTITIEAPGIGDTDLLEKPISLYKMAEDVKSVTDRDIATTGDENTIALIGHAFGNRLVRATATLYPDLAKSVVLIAAGGQKPIEKKATKELRNSILPYLPSYRRKQAIDYAFFAEGNEIPDFWIRGWHLYTAILQGEAVTNTKDENWQNAGGLPILLIQALEDVIAPKEDTADLLKKRFGQRLEIVFVEKVGHALLPEAPKEISAAIIGYLSTINTGR